jgi:hypothetical protein
MKRLTLDLTVIENTNGFLLNVRKNILGNIDNVIETLGSSMHRDNVLVDIRSFRCHNGTYEIKSRNGLLGHTRVLDTLRAHSGMLMLRPGEAVTFCFMGQYIHFFNQPTVEENAYLSYIVSKEKLRNHLDRTLQDLRNGVKRKPRPQKEEKNPTTN